MYRKNSTISDPFAAKTHFPLRDVVGRWVSRSGNGRMPQVQIIHTGKHYYRLLFSYDPQTAYNCAVWQRWGVTWFYLYGRVGLAYDAERDILTLSEYGEYQRADG